MLVGIFTAALGLLPVSAQPDPAALRERAQQFLDPLPFRMPGGENDTPALVKLGKKLYFDKRLSADRTISCHSCHKINSRGQAYAQPVLKGVSGKPIERSSPTVLNAGFHIAQFWDGRAADLKAQALEPLHNPDEMGMPPEAEMLARLRTGRWYQYRFAQAFPDAADPFSIDNMATAIASYERTLITHDRFDEFLKGKDRALSRAERKGLEVFLDLGCQQCHDGPGLGGNSFEIMGRVHSYANTNDLGRFRVTGDETDRFRFKVPSLRNVVLTAPYFHDGKAATLHAAIREMAWLQLGRELSSADVSAIETFFHALSDKTLAVQRPTVPPSIEHKH
ncbi:MAG: cytochrome-c peroxidase [Akkermansiaceae bacterium]|nr:cytochrome-c peroxidase [Verrucomicrobiales bacterium]